MDIIIQCVMSYRAGNSLKNISSGKNVYDIHTHYFTGQHIFASFKSILFFTNVITNAFKGKKRTKANEKRNENHKKTRPNYHTMVYFGFN